MLPPDVAHPLTKYIQGNLLYLPAWSLPPSPPQGARPWAEDRRYLLLTMFPSPICGTPLAEYRGPPYLYGSPHGASPWAAGASFFPVCSFPPPPRVARPWLNTGGVLTWMPPPCGTPLGRIQGGRTYLDAPPHVARPWVEYGGAYLP
jgi:hypothetical protein